METAEFRPAWMETPTGQTIVKAIEWLGDGYEAVRIDDTGVALKGLQSGFGLEQLIFYPSLEGQETVGILHSLQGGRGMMAGPVMIKDVRPVEEEGKITFEKEGEDGRVVRIAVYEDGTFERKYLRPPTSDGERTELADGDPGQRNPTLMGRFTGVDKDRM